MKCGREAVPQNCIAAGIKVLKREFAPFIVEEFQSAPVYGKALCVSIL
jgi:hypothetical protein